MKIKINRKILKIIIGLFFVAMVIFVTMPIPENKTIPDIIKPEAEKALSYFPDLDSVPITFKFKEKIKKSTMQAQPLFRSLFRPKHQRAYIVLISENIKISNKEFKTTEIPHEVMVGWLGHELGHIKDYQNRSSLDLIGFGFRYLFLENHMKSAERTADSIAVSKGMGEYIIATKRFILENAEISETYKERLKKFYLSPEEIMVMIKEHQKEN